MAEGAPLLREYRVKRAIEGANPAHSARYKDAPADPRSAGVFLYPTLESTAGVELAILADRCGWQALAWARASPLVPERAHQAAVAVQDSEVGFPATARQACSRWHVPCTFFRPSAARRPRSSHPVQSPTQSCRSLWPNSLRCWCWRTDRNCAIALRSSAATAASQW